jgi:hypothetical protein
LQRINTACLVLQGRKHEQVGDIQQKQGFPGPEQQVGQHTVQEQPEEAEAEFGERVSQFPPSDAPQAAGVAHQGRLPAVELAFKLLPAPPHAE